MYQLADNISQYWCITDISVLAYMLSHMHQYEHFFWEVWRILQKKMPVVFFLLLNSQWSWQFQCTDAFLNTFTTHQTTMLRDGRTGRPPSQSMGKDGNETQKWIFLINGTFNCIVKLQNILPVFRIYVTQVIDNYIWRIFAKSVHVSANELIWYIYIFDSNIGPKIKSVILKNIWLD